MFLLATAAQVAAINGVYTESHGQRTLQAVPLKSTSTHYQDGGTTHAYQAALLQLEVAQQLPVLATLPTAQLTNDDLELPSIR